MAYPGLQKLLDAFTLIRDAIARKQDKLTGAAGQVVGFDASGKPTAVSAGSLSGPTGILPIEKGGTGNDQGYIRTGLKAGETAGDHATAEGCETIANDDSAHAEGYMTTAIGKGAHTEGASTKAAAQGAHAEGSGTIANAIGGHAEGVETKALGGQSAHAEGSFTTATGTCAHSEGSRTTAGGHGAHAEGEGTCANNFASHAAGKFSRQMTDGGTVGNTVGDAMVIGNGIENIDTTRLHSNCFRVTYAGEVYGLSAFQSSGADYAEYFEWADGNPEGEDRVGCFVTMDGNKICMAQPGDYILGVVSGQPCIIGNADEDWLGRWEHDEFGRFVREDVFTPVTGRRDILDEQGRPTGQVVEFDTGQVSRGWRFKANPDYDPSRPYVERKDRPEWSAVGMLGVLSVRDDGECAVNGYCAAGPDGRAVPAGEAVPGQSWRVIRRLAPGVVQVVFR